MYIFLRPLTSMMLPLTQLVITTSEFLPLSAVVGPWDSHQNFTHLPLIPLTAGPCDASEPQYLPTF